MIAINGRNANAGPCCHPIDRRGGGDLRRARHRDLIAILRFNLWALTGASRVTETVDRRQQQKAAAAENGDGLSSFLDHNEWPIVVTAPQLTWRYFSEVLIEVNTVLRLVPRPLTAARWNTATLTNVVSELRKPRPNPAVAERRSAGLIEKPPSGGSSFCCGKTSPAVQN